MSQYALVPKAEPVTVAIRDEEAALIECGKTSVTSQLLNLYELYAETYPNPAIQEENHERDRLLRAISAANHAVQVNPRKEPKKASWWNIFGGTKSTKSHSTTPSIIDYENDDDRLVYKDMIDDNDQANDSEYLLGTGFSLDQTCIPEEVHSVARRYLCRHRKADHGCRTNEQSKKPTSAPNVVRTSWETAGTSCIVIVGLGQMVEFRKRTSSHNNDGTKATTTNNSTDHNYTSAGNIVYTSDRIQLLEYDSIQQKRQQSNGRKMHAMTQWNPSRADAALVGPNFLVVHWGLDSTVTFYRRVAVPTNDAILTDDSHFIVTWEAVAVSGATALVRDSLADLFHDDNDAGGGDSEMMNVTAVHPLVVEIPQHAPIVTLAVARLGGFIELLPLPPQMWYGAELPFTKKHVQSNVSQRGTKRKANDGFRSSRSTVGYNLPDLAISAVGGGSAVVLNTSNYHSDVYGIESLAISGNINESWNRELYPDGPPAQYVIAAYGTKSQTGRQAISFWSYSTHVSPSAPGGVGFSIHSTIVEAIDLGKAGPDVTLFASPIIFRHWRKPRRVELRDSSESEPRSQQITTLSLSVPIVQISFVMLDGNQEGCNSNVPVSAAVLDWNGGVTLLDCTLLVRTAAQTLNDDEYRILFGNDNPTELTSLVTVVANRTRITRSITKAAGSRPAPMNITSIKCFQNPSNNNGEILVAAMTSECLYFICSKHKNRDQYSLSFDMTTIPCSNLGRGQFLISSKRQFILNLIFLATRYTTTVPSNKSVTMLFGAVQKLKPFDIIQSLIHSKKFREAITAAERLSPIEKTSVEHMLEACKKAVWETEYDLSVLESIRDDEYIIRMARRPPLTSENNIFHGKVELYRSVCKLALDRIRNARSWAALSFSDDAIDIKSGLVKLGTYILLCDYRSVSPSLWQFFYSFIPTPILDFAMRCAMKADIETLSVLWFRHRDELHPDHLKVLNAIPVTLPHIFYQHLLPVTSTGKANDHSQILFINGSGFNDLCSISEMPEYTYHHYQRNILLDEDDESLIWEQYTLIAQTEQYNSGSLADWYLSRTLEIQKFTVGFMSIAAFAQLGLNAMQIQRFTPVGDNLPPSVLSLQQLILYSELISTIPLDEKNVSRLALKNLDDPSVSDIIALTFDCISLESVDYQNRHNDYLLPLMKSKMTSFEVSEVITFLDDAIENFCMDLMQDHESCDTADFIGKVNICSNIVHSSRASLCLTSRIISSTTIVVRLVTYIVEKVVKNSSLMQWTQVDQQSILDKLWKMYESLPVLLPSSIDSNEEITTSMEFMRKSLTFLDIVARWPDTDPFGMVVRYQKVQDSIELLLRGEEAVAVLSRSFCGQVESSFNDVLLNNKAPTLLSALLNDCNELNTNCFDGTLQMSALLITCIVKPLIKHCNAGLLGEYLPQSGHSLTEIKAIADEILLSFNEAFNGSSISTRRELKVKAAMEFRDIMEKWIPAVRDEFQPFQRCLDATNFIGSTLLSEKCITLSLEQVQSMRALDVVEYVLKHNPKAILQNGSDWGNQSWAKQTNEVIRKQIRCSEEIEQVSLTQPPPSNLPGEAIFFLARLLGLTDIPSVVAVKSLVIDAALTMNVDGAAAAVCRSLMIDAAASNVGSDATLAAVAKIVSRREYDDAMTKQELCTTAQHLFYSNMQVICLESYDVISLSLEQLQHYNILWLHDARDALQSFGTFYSNSKSISEVDIVHRVASINDQLSNGLMDDISIAELAKFASLWCIDQAMKSKAYFFSSQQRFPDAIASFAATLFLYVRDRQISLDYLKDVKAIRSTQYGTVSMLSDIRTEAARLEPNPDIVKKLIGRGYSENGARRSAIAANNHSFNEALQWAVGHSLDAGFDDPQIILHSSTDDLNIGTAQAELMKKAIDILIMSIESDEINLEVKNDKSVGMPSITTNVFEKLSSDHGKACIDEDDTKCEASTFSFDSKGSLEKDAVRQNLPGSFALQEGLHDGDRNGVPSGLTTATFKATSPTSHADSIKQPISYETNGTVALTSNSSMKLSYNLDRPSVKVTIPKSNETSPDRSTLYQVGQEAFVMAQQRRRPSSNPSRAERLRLIEEGRRLLKQAKSGLSSGSDQIGYLLRSAPTTPSTIFSNKVADALVGPPPRVAKSDTHTAPIDIPDSNRMSGMPSESTNDAIKGGDDWDFDDENFDI
jgi:hypothetical protein